MSQEYSFKDDYSELGHPRIFEALARASTEQQTGYGEDEYTKKAAQLIRLRVENPRAAVHFIPGGTQTNKIVLASLLGRFDAVIAARTAHINVHEAGAIESLGNKILTIENADGKIQPSQVKETVAFHSDEHMVRPKVVFISQATELGTVYSKKELQYLREVCDDNSLYLYLDGARIGSALTSKTADLTLPEISKLVDAFYIGGTKNGAMFGEAVVINNPDCQKDFRYHLKQGGALLAKGAGLGIQFLELFNDNLYFDLARNANQMAEQLTDGIEGLGYDFLTKSPTNQIFPVFPNKIIKRLQEKYGFYIWSKVDSTNSGIRLVTSWATPEEAVKKFIADLKLIS